MFLCLSESSGFFFNLRKNDDNNSSTAWLLLLLCELKSVRHLGQRQAPTKCSTNDNCKLTKAVTKMERMLTCDGHDYKNYL